MPMNYYGDDIATDQDISRAVLLGMEHVLEESNRIVPHETGDLERAGTASVDGNRGRVSYDSVYAVPQHERLDYVHDAGREAKYLEKAGTRTAQAVGEIIANALGEGS